MSKLIEYYEEILESLDLSIKDGYIYSSTEEDGYVITSGGLPMVLPTKQQINSLYKTEGNKLELTKLPFNPMNEDVVKGDTKSLRLLKHHMVVKLSGRIMLLGSMLLKLASDTELQTKADKELIKYLNSIEGNSKAKKLVDDTTIDLWESKLCEYMEQHSGIFELVIKKKGKVDGVDFNRIATISPLLLEDLEEVTRKKDKTTLRATLEYILPEFKDEVVTYGSNDTVAPALHALVGLYNKINGRIQYLNKKLKFVDKDIYSTIKSTEISSYDEYILFQGELSSIPNENDLGRKQETKSPISKAYPVNPVPFQQGEESRVKEIKDPLSRFKSSNNIAMQNVQQPMYVQQPMMLNQPVYQQPIQQPLRQPIQQPMQQPMINQPMYQQPIQHIQQPMVNQYGQPIYQQQPMFIQPQYGVNQMYQNNQQQGVPVNMAPGAYIRR